MAAADWRGSERLAPWSPPRRISGPTGAAGQNAVYLDLDNENHSIACFDNGTPKPGTLGFTVQGTLYDGMSIVDSGAEGVIWEVVFANASGISINNAGTIAVSDTAVLGNVTKVSVIALYKELPYVATLTLVKVLDGSGGLDGANAVQYELRPSVTAVRRDAGGANDPPTVSCAQWRTEGDQVSLSHELLKYQLSTMPYEANYVGVPNGEIIIGDAAWINFVLYGGTGMELDRERVPVVKDGQPGEDGMGIDALPRDAYACWPCDDLPDIPDDPAGVTNGMAFEYKRAASTAGFGSYYSTLSLDNGSIKSTPGGYAPNWQLVSPLQYNGKVLIARLRFSGAVNTPQILYGASNATRNMAVLRQFSDREYLAYDILDAVQGTVLRFGALSLPPTTAIIGWIDQLYIGSASYLTPLIDNSGNRRHIPLTGGTIPVPGRFGNGIRFLNRKTASVSGILDGHSGDFAVSVWSNKPADLLSKYGGGYSMGFAISQGKARFFSNNPNADLQAGTAFIVDGNMHHLLMMVKNKYLFFYVDGQLNGQLDIAEYYNDPLDNYPLLIGGLFSNYPAEDGTVIDEIAVFSRALSDAEVQALYKYTPHKTYARADWLLEPDNPLNAMQQAPRYRGTAAVADANNTGVITTNRETNARMNHGDYVMFVGTSPWVNNSLCRWNAGLRIWVELAKPTSANRQNAALYLEATSEITAGAPQAVFSYAQVASLVADAVFANLLWGKQIVLHDNGVFKTEGFEAGASGIKITAATGLVEAIGAVFKNITVDEKSNFFGNINVGSLIVSNSSPDEPSFNYPVGTTADTIVEAMKTFFGLGNTTFQYTQKEVIGFYGNTPITFLSFTFVSNPQSNAVKYEVRTNIGTTVTVLASTYNNQSGSRTTLSNALTFRYKTGDANSKTVILKNLPSSPKASGVVYADANGFLKISP